MKVKFKIQIGQKLIGFERINDFGAWERIKSGEDHNDLDAWEEGVIHGYGLEMYTRKAFTTVTDRINREIYDGDTLRVWTWKGDPSDPEDRDQYQDYEVRWMGDQGYPAFDLVGWPGESNGLSEVVANGEYVDYRVIDKPES